MTQLVTAATSTNRLLVGIFLFFLKKEKNLNTGLSLRATPALNSNSKLKKQKERIRLAVGGSKNKLARGSQDESK